MKEREGNEPQPVFLFKDKYGTYELPEELQKLCDGFKNGGPINMYIHQLAHVAYLQQAEYKGTERTLYEQHPKDKHDPVTASNIIESVMKANEGKEGLDKFVDTRNRIIQEYGAETILKLESYLGVDSKGVEAGDSKPLIGVNLTILAPLAHY